MDMEIPEEEPFGEERLLEVITGSVGAPARELAERIETAVREHARGTAPFDAETLLVLRRLPG
jgi:serine phosphatase RsbU (regulator of sigma subunit)